MSAKPLPRGDYAPPPPELRHLLGSFAELRARVRARKRPGYSPGEPVEPEVDRESLRRAGADPEEARAPEPGSSAS